MDGCRFGGRRLSTLSDAVLTGGIPRRAEASPEDGGGAGAD